MAEKDNNTMCDTINGDDYTIMQLRQWLDQLNLSKSGNKAALILRLNAVPTNERGRCPENLKPTELGDIPSDAESNGDASSETLSRTNYELELTKREHQLLKHENELLKRELQMHKHSPAPTYSAELLENTPLSLIKELMPEFNEKCNFELWAKQVHSINNTYKLGENIMRAVIISKLRGKVLDWLHNNVDCATYGVDQLLTQIETVFGCRESKLALRQRFEARKWASSESFADYFNEKMVLAGALQLDDEELLDYLIEGIPDQQLKVQALMQCFKSKEQLLRAFSKIQLSQYKKPNFEQRKTPQQINKAETRCFNCNNLGHWKTECTKPKRAPGTCFNCGKNDHRVDKCPERDQTIGNLELDDYVRILEFNFKIDNKNLTSNLETLIDTGSPVSFIKTKCIPQVISSKVLKFNNNHVRFYGINKSLLKIQGKVVCVVNLGELKVLMNLAAVPDDTMLYDAVLGRDFLSKSNAKLVFDSNVNNDSVIRDNIVPLENFSNILDLDSCSELENKEVLDQILEVNNINLERRTENINSQVISREYFKNVSDLENYTKLEDKEIVDLMNINLGNEKKELNISDTIDLRDKELLMKLFDECYLLPNRPTIPDTKHEMRLVLNSEKPFSCCPRRISFSEKEELRKIINEYLEKEYIRPSNSEYASAIVLVKKKNKELRMCVDYRNLNKITAKDNYPIPLIEDLLDKLARKSFFTKLDLKNGFYHVFMHPKSIRFTSFVTPLGQFEFLRMPFGLKNAPAVFQRFVNTVFADMVQSEEVIIYLDDIMIATDNLEQHYVILEKVFKRLVQNKLELRLDKCEFLQPKIKYLGYVISYEGIQADDKGLRAIINFPIPSTTHALQSFLGLCSYFRRFVKDFSTIAKPLHDLTKKNIDFKFGQCELESFEMLKTKLLESPVLALYNPNSETELHCDASCRGFGAILLQKGHDNKMHPVFYFSKRTSIAESKYHSFELETLAIVYALKRFRIYLQGKNFKIVTDCNSLKQTLEKKEVNPRIARWALELYNFDYTLEHRSSDRMKHVDALSRNNNIMVVSTNSFEETLLICQNRDKNIDKLKKTLEKSESNIYEMRNGVLYRKKDRDNLLFYVPEEMENHVIFKYHNEMGHVGAAKTIELIQKSYWFPKLQEKVTNHIQNCLNCIAFSDNHGRAEGFLHNIPKTNKPFYMVHIDHYGPVDSTVKSKKYILVVIDAFTKFVRLYSTRTTNSKEAINALSEYFRAYCRPRYIVSDRGSCFTSKDFENFLAENDVKHIRVATASPQANGQAERVNRTMRPIIAKLANTSSWYKEIEKVEFVLNNTIHKTTGEHPSVMLFGVNQRGRNGDPFKDKILETLSQEVPRDLKLVRRKAKTKQAKLQIYNKKIVDKKRKKPRKYAIDDYVMIKNFDCSIGAPRKLIPRYKGPYKIFKILRKDRYMLKDVNGFQQSQIPYIGTWAVNNIRPWLGYKVKAKNNNSKIRNEIR